MGSDGSAVRKRIRELWGKDGVYWGRRGIWSIYVGQSKNIGRRIDQHIDTGTDFGKYLIKYPRTKIHHVSRFETLEVQFIKLLRPWLNKQHNPRRENNK